MMNDRRPRNKEQTIQDILKAATHLFSVNGFHGTPLRDIEKASGVSKGLILHHFESKEKLYAVVQEQLTQNYVAWLLAHRQDDTDLVNSIEAAISGAFTYANEHSDFQRIALWTYLEGLAHNSEIDKNFTSNLIEAMRAGQEEGEVREDIKAFVMPFIIKGAIDYWVQKKALRGELNAELSEEDRVSDEAFIKSLVQLMLK